MSETFALLAQYSDLCIVKLTDIMTSKELLKILYTDGWLDKVQKGSHLQMVHLIKKGKVTVPIHSGDVPKGTLNSILKQAGLK